MARAGTTRGFVQSVNNWAKDIPENATEVFRNGSLDMYDRLIAETPVDTGNLRNSLVVSVAGESVSTVTGPGMSSSDSTFRSGAEQSIANIMNVKLGQKLSYEYHATYARRLNYGFTGFDSLGRFYNQAGRFWIQRVGAQYRSIMRAAASRLKGAVK